MVFSFQKAYINPVKFRKAEIFQRKIIYTGQTSFMRIEWLGKIFQAGNHHNTTFPLLLIYETISPVLESIMFPESSRVTA